MKTAILWILVMFSAGGAYVGYRFLAEEEPALFGLICALAGILASVFGSLAVSSSAKSSFEKLAKVTEIRKLIEQADSEAARKRALEEAIDNLELVVARETRKLFIDRRLKELEANLLKISNEYEQLEAEAADVAPRDVAPEFVEKVKDLLYHIRLKESLRQDLDRVGGLPPLFGLAQFAEVVVQYLAKRLRGRGH